MNSAGALAECGWSTGIVVTDDGPGISVHVDGLSPDGARHVAGALVRLADGLTPASPEGLRALALLLDTINEARGTSHTPDSLAAACGVELDEATAGDVTRMAYYIGGTLMR